MKFIRVIKADILKDYNEKQEQKDALKKYKKAWNYYKKYYYGKQAPKELEDYMMQDEQLLRYLTQIYLEYNIKLNSLMKEYIKNNSININIHQIDNNQLLEFAKYVNDEEVALELALKLKKEKIKIPENIKKLMVKAYNFPRYIKYFKEDINNFDNKDFVKELEKDEYSYNLRDYIEEYGIKELSKNIILNYISKLDIEELISYYISKKLGEEYDDILAKQISKKIVIEEEPYDYYFRFFSKSTKNIHPYILNSLIKNEKLLTELFCIGYRFGYKFPQQVIDKMIEKVVENEDKNILNGLLFYCDIIPSDILDHYMQDIKKAAKLYLDAIDYKIKIPQKLIDMIASNEKLSYQVYKKSENNSRLDNKILNSARNYIQDKMSKNK